MKDVVDFLCNTADRTIHWPSLAEITDTETALQEMASFPGVLVARWVTQCVIENAFGFLRGRIRQLRYLECKLERVPKNIIACSVLHNVTVCDKTETDILLGDCDCLLVGEGGINAPRGTDDVATAKQKHDRIADMLL